MQPMLHVVVCASTRRRSDAAVPSHGRASCTCAAANPVARGTCTEARGTGAHRAVPKEAGSNGQSEKLRRNSDETQTKLKSKKCIF